MMPTRIINVVRDMEVSGESGISCLDSPLRLRGKHNARNLFGKRTDISIIEEFPIFKMAVG